MQELKALINTLKSNAAVAAGRGENSILVSIETISNLSDEIESLIQLTEEHSYEQEKYDDYVLENSKKNDQ
ncbi:hypothetical protein [Priestia megaterium]|uniref:Uncharacterized protein n=1 Tax=Priestia megaterium TaxID=1404 RepID=A0A6M6DJB8_PRIMG|nr:hypothetical protein [Priestia megaterium]QJX74733.1 hypothetical protein FDZ14_00505 [Priestia megaterium]